MADKIIGFIRGLFFIFIFSVSMLSTSFAKVNAIIKFMLMSIPYNNQELVNKLAEYDLSSLDLKLSRELALTAETSFKFNRLFLNFETFSTGFSYDCEEIDSSGIIDKRGSSVFSFAYFANLGLSVINARSLTLNVKGGAGLAFHSLNVYDYTPTQNDADYLLSHPQRESNLYSYEFLGNLAAEINLYAGPLNLNVEGGYIHEFSSSDWYFKGDTISNLPKIKIDGPYVGAGLGIRF